MKTPKQKISLLCACGAMLILMLNPRVAAAGAAAGIQICLEVVIPSLFPFFFITSLLNPLLYGLTGFRCGILRSLLRFPEGSEPILFLGILGGYPVGAQLVAQNYQQGALSKRTARILLGYCSNAGPAFLFGMVGSLFSGKWIPWLLWLIHILSALITALLLPRPEAEQIQVQSATVSIPQALQNALRTTASVCGWIVIFRILIQFVQQWTLLNSNPFLAVLLAGTLELSNGCILLANISAPSIRFILCGAFLGFGGMCVGMQTASVCKDLGVGLYTCGKLAQTSVSVLLAIPVSRVLFGPLPVHPLFVIMVLMTCVVICWAARQQSQKKLWKLCAS